MATIGNISALLSSVHLPEEALTALHFPSRSIILEEGKVADKLYYVRSGCLRLAFNNDGKDITFHFFFPGDIVASFDSLHNGTPSLFSLECIEPSELLAIDGKELKNIVRANDVLRDEYEKLLADRFHAYQQLFLSRIRNTPQQRYEELLRQNPELVRRIPQRYIASYLGITPVSLIFTLQMSIDILISERRKTSIRAVRTFIFLLIAYIWQPFIFTYRLVATLPSQFAVPSAGKNIFPSFEIGLKESHLIVKRLIYCWNIQTGIYAASYIFSHIPLIRDTVRAE